MQSLHLSMFMLNFPSFLIDTQAGCPHGQSRLESSQAFRSVHPPFQRLAVLGLQIFCP